MGYKKNVMDPSTVIFYVVLFCQLVRTKMFKKKSIGTNV